MYRSVQGSETVKHSAGSPVLLILVFILSFICSGMKAQDSLDSYTVDKRSYDLYQEKKWKELISFVDQALKQDHDYYYLRMRIGIAHYELGNFIAAQKHFEKALEFNSGDELVLEYIYFCYLFSYRFEEARNLSRKFPPALAEKLKTADASPIAYALVEAGQKVADSTRLLGRGHYAHVGLSHYVSNRFSLYHAFTYYSQGFGDSHKMSGKLTQLQYYISANVPLKNNWQVAPAFQWLTKTTALRILPAPPPPPPPGQPFPKLPEAKDSTVQDNYFVGSFNLKKIFSKFDLSFSTTVSSVFGANQFQHGLSASYYPLKKRKLIAGCNAYMHTEDSYSSANFCFVPFLYVNPVKRLAFTFSYLNNTGGKNAVENNGYIVNNSSDLTTSRWSGIATVNITKQFDLYGLYQFENKTASAAKYTYHYNLFVAGIRIRPKR
ncbi:MAG: tetratricopeptide repeat protein [Bacteroidia bacterium]